MKNRVTVKRAAELLGTSELTVRYGIEHGELPIGTAIHTSPYRTNYHIAPNKLAEYLHIPLDQVLEEKINESLASTAEQYNGN